MSTPLEDSGIDQAELDGIVAQYRQFTEPHSEMILADHFDVEHLACVIERLAAQLSEIREAAGASPDSPGMEMISTLAAPRIDWEHSYVYGHPRLGFITENHGFDADSRRFMFARFALDEVSGQRAPVHEITNREWAQKHSENRMENP